MLARGGRVALVEEEVDDGEHRSQPGRQLVGTGRVEAHPRFGQRAFGPDDALGHGRRGDEESARDLVGCETGQHLEGQRGLRLGSERRMARNEHQPQYVVVDRLGQLDLAGLGQPAAEELDLAGQRDVPAGLVDRPPFGDGRQPGARTVGDPGRRPLLEGGHQRVLGEVLRSAHVVDVPGQAGDQAGRLDPPDRLDGAVGAIAGHLAEVTALSPTRASAYRFGCCSATVARSRASASLSPGVALSPKSSSS